MSQKDLERAYNEFINGRHECPNCGGIMQYVGGLLDWECSDCGVEGSLVYDEVNKEDYIVLAMEYSYDKIYEDPVNNMPACCRSCGGPYPNCVTSCKIFDD